MNLLHTCTVPGRSSVCVETRAANAGARDDQRNLPGEGRSPPAVIDASGYARRDAVRGGGLIQARHALRRRRRTLALVWLAAAVLAVSGLAMSLAVFVRQTPMDETFSVGTISLGLAPAGTLITFAGMVPGNAVDGVLTIQNDGTGDLRYAMTAVATDPDAKHLRDVLQLDVERRTGCSGAVLEVLYSGPIATAAFGDPQPGGDPGDRPVDSGASEVLCFRATLPLGTDTQQQGATTTATLTFRAEQVSGNP